MAVFDNVSFESEGAGPGLASSWTFTSVATYFDIAPFTGTGSPTWETFESGWGVDAPVFEYAPTDIQVMQFDSGFVPKAHENFERLWSGNEAFVTTADGFSAGTPDAFEDWWALITSLIEDSNLTRLITANNLPADNFDWPFTFLSSFSEFDVEAAPFVTGAGYENFEDIGPEKFTGVAAWPML